MNNLELTCVKESIEYKETTKTMDIVHDGCLWCERKIIKERVEEIGKDVFGDTSPKDSPFLCIF